MVINIIRFNYVLKSLVGNLSEYLHLESRFFSIFHLTRLIFLIFTVAHCCGLGFYGIGEFAKNDGNNYSWIDKADIYNLDWMLKYERALYFSLITMITVGYGDVTPQNSLERIYVMVVTIISCGVFAYAVNTVGSIFQKMDSDDSSIRKK